MAAELILHEGAAPSTPGTDKATLYLDTSNRICFKGEDGNVYVLAVLEKDQTFTETNTFQPTGTAAGDRAVYIKMPSGSTANPIRIEYNALGAILVVADADETGVTLSNRDLGNNIAGPKITLGRNNNAGTEGVAAGTVNWIDAGGTNYFVWVDDAGLLRIHTAAPTGSSGSPTVSDTAGTVVGTQSSFSGSKDLHEDLSLIEDVLARVRSGAAAVQRFMYKEKQYNGEVFEGVVTDLAPAYGMDRDAEHPQGKSLNEIQILGDLLRVVAHLVERVEALEESS